jgi:hypothetical protein
MYKEVSFRGFNRFDSRLYNPCAKRTHGAALIATWINNRATIQVYLHKIQQRIDRGSQKGALQLFNRLVVLINPPLWVISALRNELRRNSQ